MPDRRIDDESRNRLTEIAAGYAKLDRRVLWHLRAFVTLFFISAVGFTYLLAVNNHRADEARSLSASNQRLLGDLTATRNASRVITCGSQNTFTAAHNQLVQALEQIVLSSTRDSRALQSRALRQLHLPSYAHRLAVAKAYARKLDDRKIAPLDCKRYVRKPYRIKQRG